MECRKVDKEFSFKMLKPTVSRSHRGNIQRFGLLLEIASLIDFEFSRFTFSLSNFGIHVLELSVTTHSVSCKRSL